VLFPTFTFAAFFAVVLPASWLLMHRPLAWRWGILAASYVFYGSWDWRFVFLLAASTVANQVFAKRIDAVDDERQRSRRLAFAVVANLAALGWFKYANFVGENSASLLRRFGWHIEPPFARVLLPIGISFFTFQALSYVIDVRRRRLRPTTLLDFAVYLSFFPHLVAGPIVRAGEFLPQLRHQRDARRVDAGIAFWLIALGLFKKVVIASYLASHSVDPLFALPFRHGGVEALVGVYAYAIQIYADFSGYTDMAIGLALLLGFRFPLNFDAPYTATSLQDFWRRWHMTLSRWLRDYLYVPLGGNQRGRARTYANLLTVMVLGGLWHGAAWTFVVWGLLHGLGLVVERWFGDRRARRDLRRAGGAGDRGGGAAAPVGSPAASPILVSVGPHGGAVAARHVGTVASGAPSPDFARDVGPGADVSAVAAPRRVWLRRIVTFNFVCACWVFFRASSVDDAMRVFDQILRGHSAVPVNPIVVLVIVGMLACQYVPKNAVGRMQAWFAALPVWAMATCLAVVLVAVDVLGPDGVPPFIYYRF
jgi:D-alanyl-lipoteichoic acid acyltransferase DltB (MBOAT superfamily)